VLLVSAGKVLVQVEPVPWCKQHKAEQEAVPGLRHK